MWSWKFVNYCVVPADESKIGSNRKIMKPMYNLQLFLEFCLMHVVGYGALSLIYDVPIESTQTPVKCWQIMSFRKFFISPLNPLLSVVAGRFS